MVRIHLFRVYDDGPPPPGRQVLVERLWPRGVRRDDLALDAWLKDVAELDARPDAWRPLLEGDGDVTLIYSSRDREHNNAVALRDYLLERAGD
jgi:uncharacterized protein YeaO (DUF488 family)